MLVEVRRQEGGISGHFLLHAESEHRCAIGNLVFFEKGLPFPFRVGKFLQFEKPLVRFINHRKYTGKPASGVTLIRVLGM